MEYHHFGIYIPLLLCGETFYLRVLVVICVKQAFSNGVSTWKPRETAMPPRHSVHSKKLSRGLVPTQLPAENNSLIRAYWH